MSLTKVTTVTTSASDAMYAMLCDAMRCYAMLCDAMLCYAVLCYLHQLEDTPALRERVAAPLGGEAV